LKTAVMRAMVSSLMRIGDETDGITRLERERTAVALLLKAKSSTTRATVSKRSSG